MEFFTVSDWQQLPANADALFAQAERESVFFSRPWFENLCRYGLEQDQTMLLACVQHNGSIMAILPLVQTGEDSWSSLSHRYSSLYSPLLAERELASTLTCLVDGLAALPCHTLRLEPVSASDNKLQQLLQALQTAGYSCHRGFRFYNWIHRPDGQAFDDYMAARPGRMRNTIERKWRKLQREHKAVIRLFSQQDAIAALDDYHASYRSSWKAHEQYRPLLDGMVERFAPLGWVRLAILYIDEVPAAAQLWFVVQAKASIFRLAYDESWKQYSPGSILTRFLMQQVIDHDKVEEIDFLTGNETYKQDWMSERRERHGIACSRQQTVSKDLKQRLLSILSAGR